VFAKSTHDGFDLWHPGFASRLSEGLKAPKFHNHSFLARDSPRPITCGGTNVFVPPGEVTALSRRRKTAQGQRPSVAGNVEISFR
jgi:hypothetical protein